MCVTYFFIFQIGVLKSKLCFLKSENKIRAHVYLEVLLHQVKPEFFLYEKQTQIPAI